MDSTTSSRPEDKDAWDELNARKTPEWFDRSRLGIFVHWGAYSVAGWAEPIGALGTIDDSTWFPHNPYAEWFYNTIRIEGSPAKAYFEKNWPGRNYDDLLDAWETPTVDYQALLASFKEAGAGYVVLTTKHHDGIALWDAPDTHGRNTVARGPRHDLVAEYKAAAEKNGLRFGAYYSGGLDWHVRPYPAHQTQASVLGDRPQDEEYAAFAGAHVRDLIHRYSPDLLWDDLGWPEAGKTFAENGIGKIFQEYYATVPEGVVNDRWHVPHHGYRTSEYQFMQESEDAQAWENCRGIGFSFGYNANEEKESLDSRGVIRHLVDVASRGGHLLLGVGPKADGSLPEFQQRVLAGMATWMAEGGNTLGGLRPSRESFATLASPGFIREGQTNSSHYVYVDSDDPVESVLLQTTKKPSLLPGSFASLKQVDAGYLVELGPNRNGPAVLELR